MSTLSFRCHRIIAAAFSLGTAIAILSIGTRSEAAETTMASANRADSIYQKLTHPDDGIFIVAHRGCHNPSPLDGLDSAPENSLTALEHCVALGVDMMELDVRRTKDGVLVILHDDSVDRTTNGSGKVNALTLAQLKQLRLRKNSGGTISPLLTEQAVPTLTEILDRAKGRIMLNLDIKEDIYPETIAAAVKAGMANQVLVKKTVNADLSPLADEFPYNRVPFQIMVAGRSDPSGPKDLAAIISRQASSKKPLIGVEMILLTQPEFDTVSAAAKTAHIRLWATTLNEGAMLSLTSIGGDIDALRDPDSSWGYLIDHGANIILTDEPGPLLRYLKTRREKH
jgi:glycerophosphoryl diester phosphodiesterase